VVRLPTAQLNMAKKLKLDGEALHDLKEKIAQEVHKLVNKHTAKLHPDDDEELRQTLTDEFRFWRY